MPSEDSKLTKGLTKGLEQMLIHKQNTESVGINYIHGMENEATKSMAREKHDIMHSVNWDSKKFLART